VIDDTIYAYYGSSFQENVPLIVTIDKFDYKVEMSMPVSLDFFLNSAIPNKCDGYIFGISGEEYKVKEFPTVDLDVRINGVFSRDGKEFNGVTGVNGIYGVCEFRYNDSCFTFVRKRYDKLHAEDNSTIMTILQSPPLSTVRTMLKAFTGKTLLSCLEVYPLNYMISVIAQYIVQSKVQPVIVSPLIIGIELRKKRIYVRGVDTIKVYNSLGASNKERFVRLHALDVKKLIINSCSYVTRASMYENLVKIGCAGPLFGIAVALASHVKRIVSIRKLFLMCARHELNVIGNIVVPKRCAMVVDVFKDLSVPRNLVVYDVNDPRDALVKYNIFNEGPHTTDSELHHFLLECDELMNCNLTVEAMEEIGDVIYMLVKLVIRLHADRHLLVDDTAAVWGVMFTSPVMQPFLDKMRERVKKWGCVRNHNTCATHRCSTGAFFNGNDKTSSYTNMIVSYPDTED